MARKKQVRFFGNNIAPNCSWCVHASAHNTEECALHQCIDLSGKCADFDYDPLRREPQREKRLDTEQFGLEDFTL